MNWRAILALSGFGFAMGLASVWGFVGKLELPLWLAIGVFCGVWLARRSPGRSFLHGFCVGLIAGAIAALVQTSLLDTYLALNPDSAADVKNLPGGLTPRLFFLALAPFAGLINGVVFGLVGAVAAMVVGRRRSPGAGS